jgi:hypothetical protein
LEAQLFYFILKNALVYYNAGVVVVKSEVVGLAPESGGQYYDHYFKRLSVKNRAKFS